MMLFSVLLPLIVGLAILFFLYLVFRAERDIRLSPDWVKQTGRLTFAGHFHPMERKDRLPVLIITLVYALTAFFHLGTTDAPKQVYDFANEESVTLEFSGSPVTVAGLRYYSGLGVGEYNVELSSDGETWHTLWAHHDDQENPDKVTGWYWADAEGFQPSYAMTQGYNQLYKWLDITVENPQPARFLRITGRPSKTELQLSKLCLLDEHGQPIQVNFGMADGSEIPSALSALLFVDSSVPEKSTWYNSTYFDEIYHARTAKEHIDGVYPYEITHPPLGKLIMGLGIRLFGMNPFGWRFMGTLLGVLMLPILYIFLKNMFGKTPVAACGTILFAADFMHLTQTRIATIDTYGVFFILCMYFFMFRYLTLPQGTSFARGALPLGLSGLMWGLGAASKWTVIYAAVGLAILYFMGFYQRMRDWSAPKGRVAWCVKTLLYSVLMFVVIPFFLYTLSYWPYAAAAGSTAGLGTHLLDIVKFPFVQLPQLLGEYLRPLAEGEQHTFPISGSSTNLVDIMLRNQHYMLTYHQGVSQAHPYSSRWYEWVVNARPILYYMDNSIPGHTVRFAAFSNPVVCWTGFFAMLICAARSFRRLAGRLAYLLLSCAGATAVTLMVDPRLEQSQLTPGLVLLVIAMALLYLALGTGAALLFPRQTTLAPFILIGWLSQLVPWMFIGRTTFEYHYFPSILFLVLAISALFDTLMDSRENWKLPVYGLTSLSVGCYVLFYPLLIGISIPTWYEALVRWLPSWPL